MNYLRYYIVSTILCLLPMSLTAAVQFEVKNKNSSETIWSDGKNVHINSDNEPSYLLLNADDRTMFSINVSDKNILNLSEQIKNIPHIPDMKSISIEIFKHGAGPIMFGYSTELYLLKVNGEICRSEYLSKDIPELVSMTSALALIAEYQINTTFGNLPAQLDLCFVAEHMTYKRYSKYGFPIKSEDQYGKADFEIVAVKKGVENPVHNFKLPEGYTVISYDEMMNSTGMVPEGGGNEMHPTVLGKDILVPK